MHPLSRDPVTTTSLDFDVHLVWDGNTGRGTADYDAYARDHRAQIQGKPDLPCSAAARFRGDPSRHDPEDLFVAALSSCHMLSYLALCARSGVVVVAYEDRAHGVLALDARGGGRFAAVTLRPIVNVEREAQVALATRLHATAHERCFIAASVAAPVTVEPVVRVAAVAP